MLLDGNFDFLGGYLVVTTEYCSLPDGYCSLLVVTARYRSLLLVPIFTMIDDFSKFCFKFGKVQKQPPEVSLKTVVLKKFENFENFEAAA